MLATLVFCLFLEQMALIGKVQTLKRVNFKLDDFFLKFFTHLVLGTPTDAWEGGKI